MKIKFLPFIFFTIIFIQNRKIYSQNLFGVFSVGKGAIKGESIINGHTNEIELISYQIELQKNSRGMENKMCVIVKKTDTASTAMFQAMQLNDLKTFTIQNFQSAKAGIQSLQTVLDFEKAQITNIRQWYDETKQRTIEEVKFNYNKLKISYIPKNQVVEVTIGDPK